MLRAAICTMAVLVVAGCGKEKDDVMSPYLDAVPEHITETALGEGDGLLLSIRSNVSWTLSAEDENGNKVDWLILRPDSGEGDADVFGTILRGDREEDRSCVIVLRSQNGNLPEKKVILKQGIFVPVILEMHLYDVVKTGKALKAGESDVLTDFGFLNAEVVGVPGPNLPEGYVYVSDDEDSWVRVKTDQASTLKIGDKVRIELTEGTVTKDASGGLTANIPSRIEVLSSGEASVSPAYVSTDALERYEYMLVQLRNVQAAQGAIGKSWSGDVSFIATDEANTPFTVHVDAGAGFSGSVPSGSGTVTGIVMDGKVCPRTADDISDLKGERMAEREEFVITPIFNYFRHSGKNQFSNGQITNGTKFTFSDAEGYSMAGAAIEKVVGESNNLKYDVADSAPWSTCFVTVQWHLDGTYLLYTIPINQKVWGDLEWSFSISCGGAGVFVDDWTVYWSTDGIQFNPVDAVYDTTSGTPEDALGPHFKLTHTTHNYNRQVAEFSIPENEAITGGNLYFKLVPPTISASYSSRTLRVNCGSVLHSRTKNTVHKDYHHILAMENFERQIFSHNPVIGVPTYYFSYNPSVPAYIGPDGWTVSGDSQALRGCVHLSAKSGENYIVSPALEKLKNPTDVTLTFKAAPYVDATSKELKINENNISVRVSGSGKAGELVWDTPFASNPYEWHKATVKIAGASSDTRIMIGNLDSGISASQCYLDDIIISR